MLHVPFTYHPDPVGGTEIYAEALARELEKCGIDTAIAAPGLVNAHYQHKGLPIYRFNVARKLSLRQLYGEGDPTAAREFKTILAKLRPNVVHLHAFTSAVSTLLVEAANDQGCKVVFTYHTPTVSCQRGTLMRWGTEVCDGVLDRQTCTKCTLDSLSVHRGGAFGLSYMPPVFGRLLDKASLEGGPWTALRMSELIELRQHSFRHLMSQVDRVIALCQWSKDLLFSNGVPGQKIVLIRHGLPHAESQVSVRDTSSSGHLRMAFFGRLDYAKGPDVLIEALRLLPKLPIALDIYGITQDKSDPYLEKLRKSAQEDSRINFLTPVDSKAVVAMLRSYDVLAVPSRCLETGPLVVLEAFAAGVPAIGSRLGGIAELVRDNFDGLLLPPDDIPAWSAALRRLNNDRGTLARLRDGVLAPRCMALVAREMLNLYDSLLE